MSGLRQTALVALLLTSATASANATSFFDVFAPVVPQQASVTHEEQDEAAPATSTAIKRAIVDYAGHYAPGTVVVSTSERRLYFVLSGGKAVAYAVGVGRQGFQWDGRKTITRKQEWPEWRPPQDMLKRRPDLPRYMAGGPENPLGARAMYLGGTLYRIHGSNEPETIGHEVSSGCIRMLNDDVVDLYERVRVGTPVIVLK